MRRLLKSGSDGYSFIELIVVCAIIGILASAIMPLARVTMQRQREFELRRDLREMRTAIDKFKDAADLGVIPSTELSAGSEGYPTNLEMLVEGVQLANDASGRRLKFLRRIPIDPMTGTAEWGLRSYQDKPDATSWGDRMCTTCTRRAEVVALTDRSIVTGRRIAGRTRPSVAAGRSGPRDAVRRGAWRVDGFTLIELLIVVTLIVVLAGMGLASYATSITRAKEAVLKEDLFRMRDAIDQYYADKAKYPADLTSLVSEGYLRRVPEDPFTQSADTWQTQAAEIDAANPAAEPGVFDVKSGSDATGLDGSRYADW